MRHNSPRRSWKRSTRSLVVASAISRPPVCSAHPMCCLNPDFLDDPQLTNVLTAKHLAWLRSADGGGAIKERFRTLFGEGKSDAELRVIMATFYEKLLGAVGYLAKKNANLLFGTDTAIGMGYGNPPGYNGYLEMQAWHRGGVTLNQIFRAATISNARAFHIDDEVGTIEEGKRANLLLLGQNPLETVEAYDSIQYVVIRGELVERHALSARSAGVE